ncbi:LytTR family DNA-binding domain-containing protein [Duganella levis]|uniref:HTH LytTR-type domain-containing protein n=1 Tax=Duganella levis TaxID=2692169 RepID=A0ABW9VYK1_9BURK|nr:LytTR family DNA-binding domain-containing protein [Duganella levis]MYN26736.1 hypothetical protein [Duganella levis]
MTTSVYPDPVPAAMPAWLRSHAWALVYWLAFLLVLEPGNVLRASQAGQLLSLPHEALRILVAAMLGTTVTSVIQILVERFPLHGPHRASHFLIHAAAAAGLALTLILASCFLAAWVFAGKWLPSWDEMWDQLMGNFTLLMFALAALTALVQRRATPTPAPSDTPAPAIDVTSALTHVEIKRRGQVISLALSEVDWIEAQGNYVALHVGAEQHLVRDTLSRFADKLDAGKFLRIHRSMVVALDRITAVEALANGDSLLHLAHGDPLRASRTYAAAIKAIRETKR